jgi:hypothetical protein
MSGRRVGSPAAQVASPVRSPCIDVCRMDAASGLCAGCWRTLDEIAAWSALDDDAKRAVWQRLRERRAQAQGQAQAATPPEGGR